MPGCPRATIERRNSSDAVLKRPGPTLPAPLDRKGGAGGLSPGAGPEPGGRGAWPTPALADPRTAEANSSQPSEAGSAGLRRKPAGGAQSPRALGLARAKYQKPAGANCLSRSGASALPVCRSAERQRDRAGVESASETPSCQELTTRNRAATLRAGKNNLGLSPEAGHCHPFHPGRPSTQIGGAVANCWPCKALNGRFPAAGCPSLPPWLSQPSQ